jgi:hypothetical protein
MSTSNTFKKVPASFEKTAKENTDLGMTSGIYLNNFLSMGGRNRTICSFPSSGFGRSSSDHVRRTAPVSSLTGGSNTKTGLDDWVSNSSVHSNFSYGMHEYDSDSTTESCDSFGEGDVDDWEVPSISADINTSRSRRGATLSGRNMMIHSNNGRRTTRQNLGFVPETILESISINSKHESNSGHSSKDSSRHSSSKHHSSHHKMPLASRRFNEKDSDDSDADSFG